jgi:hypothetical protein
MLTRNQSRSARQAWIELAIGGVLLALAALYWAHAYRSVSSAPRRERPLLVAAGREDAGRQRKALRDAFVRQLGLPVGLLADLAAKSL